MAHNGNWDTAMSQFNAEGAELVRDDPYFRKRRGSVSTPKSETKKRIVQDWRAPCDSF
jgi:hypothetical protein